MIVQKQWELTDFRNICFLCWNSGTCEKHVSSNTCPVSLLPLSYTGHKILRQHHLQIKEITKNKRNGRWKGGGCVKTAATDTAHIAYSLCIFMLFYTATENKQHCLELTPCKWSDEDSTVIIVWAAVTMSYFGLHRHSLLERWVCMGL